MNSLRVQFFHVASASTQTATCQLFYKGMACHPDTAVTMKATNLKPQHLSHQADLQGLHQWSHGSGTTLAILENYL